MIATCNQSLKCLNVNFSKWMNIFLLQINRERKYEYDPIEKYINENIVQD